MSAPTSHNYLTRPTNPLSARFYELLREAGELHARKQADYGSDIDPWANVNQSARWGISPWIGAMLRLNDKVVRLQSFAKKGALANESVEDSLRDIAVYAVIALVLYEQESANANCDKPSRSRATNLPLPFGPEASPIGETGTGD